MASRRILGLIADIGLISLRFPRIYFYNQFWKRYGHCPIKKTRVPQTIIHPKAGLFTVKMSSGFTGAERRAARANKPRTPAPVSALVSAYSAPINLDASSPCHRSVSATLQLQALQNDLTHLLSADNISTRGPSINFVGYKKGRDRTTSPRASFRDVWRPLDNILVRKVRGKTILIHHVYGSFKRPPVVYRIDD